MPAPDRAKGERLHAIIQSAQKFNPRYATLGFSDKANLDEGHMWPTAFALKELTADEETRIGALVKKVLGIRGQQSQRANPFPYQVFGEITRDKRRSGELTVNSGCECRHRKITRH
jgi:hypothetical protein